MKSIHEKEQKVDLNPIYKFAAKTAKVTLSTVFALVILLPRNKD